MHRDIKFPLYVNTSNFLCLLQSVLVFFRRVKLFFQKREQFLKPVRRQGMILFVLMDDIVEVVVFFLHRHYPAVTV